MAGNIRGHVAPGVGELMPGWWFAVPQNPSRGASVVPNIGDIIGASYVVPQNPIKDFMTGQVKMIGQGNGAPKGGNVGVGDCGCGGTCGGCGHDSGGGMGDISTDLSTAMTALTNGDFAGFGNALLALIQEPVVMGIPLWATAIGAYFAFNALAGHEVTVSRRRH